MATAMSQYRVQPNESPASIARKHGVSVGALMNANRHKPLTTVAGKHTWQSLRHGETLNVPRTRTGMVGDDPSQMAAITSTKLNLRASPFSDGTIVGGNSQGDFVSVMDWNAAPPDAAAPQGWAQVSSPMGLDASGNPGRKTTVDGFMSKQFLALQPTLAPMPVSALPPSGLPGLPIPANFLPPGFSIPGLTPSAPTPLPPPAPPSPAAAAQALAAALRSGGCAGCGDTSSPLSTATYAFKKASLNDPNCIGMACGNMYGSTYNTQGAAMYAYGPGTQTALSKAIGSTAPAACTDSNGSCLGGPSPAPAPVLPTIPGLPNIPGLPAIFPVSPSAPSSGGQTATITATKLNIRATPSATAAVVGGNSSGDTVNVLNWNGAPADSSAPSGWAQVSSPRGLDVAGNPGRSSPVTGYMSKQYLSLSAAPAPTPAPQVAGTCPPGQMYIPLLGCQPIPGLPPVQPATPSTPSQPTIPVQPAKLDTTCPPGQMYVPLLGCQPVPVLPSLPPPTPPSPGPSPSPTPTIISCPPGQIMNPLTGKCSALPSLPIPIPVLPSPGPSPAPGPGPGPIQPSPPTPPATTKAGLSTGTLVAAGLGVAALVGVVAYAATRKKTGARGKRGKSGHKGKSAHKSKGKKK